MIRAFALSTIALCVIVGIACYHLGKHTADRRRVRDLLRSLGFTGRTKDRYLEAIDILNGLTNLNRLDGEFAADLLSDKTKARIKKVLDAHRKDTEDRHETVA